MDGFTIDAQPNDVFVIRRGGAYGPQIGSIRNQVVYSGGNGAYGGTQVGYINGEAIMAGGSGPYGGKQVAYLRGSLVYEGQSTSRQIGTAEPPHPHVRAAALVLLT